MPGLLLQLFLERPCQSDVDPRRRAALDVIFPGRDVVFAALVIADRHLHEAAKVDLLAVCQAVGAGIVKRGQDLADLSALDACRLVDVLDDLSGLDDRAFSGSAGLLQLR